MNAVIVLLFTIIKFIIIIHKTQVERSSFIKIEEQIKFFFSTQINKLCIVDNVWWGVETWFYCFHKIFALLSVIAVPMQLRSENSQRRFWGALYIYMVLGRNLKKIFIYLQFHNFYQNSYIHTLNNGKPNQSQPHVMNQVR